MAEENRESLEKQIRLKIETEHNTSDIAALRGMIQDRWSEEDKKWTAMDKRLDKIEAEISIYKFAIKFTKAVGLTIAAVLAFKFGDIKGFWS